MNALWRGPLQLVDIVIGFLHEFERVIATGSTMLFGILVIDRSVDGFQLPNGAHDGT